MERNVLTISKRKFVAMSSKRQHLLLSQLAELCLADDADLARFQLRYDELIGWVDLDSYRAPSWLGADEALEEFRFFHRAQAGLMYDDDDGAVTDGALSWVPRFPFTVVTDQVRSPFNLGSILRVIDNFGFEGLVFSGAMRLDHPRLHRAARGCEAWIPMHQEPDLPAWLDQRTRPLIGLEADPNAVPVGEWQVPSEALLLLGNERYGIARELRQRCDQWVTIPMFGFKQSMNVSAAFAVMAQRIVEFNDRNGK